jgi:hypothetical protein
MKGMGNNKTKRFSEIINLFGLFLSVGFDADSPILEEY